MPKLRRVSGRKTIRTLERIGFAQVRQRGSHVTLKKQTPQGDLGGSLRNCVETFVQGWPCQG